MNELKPLLKHQISKSNIKEKARLNWILETWFDKLVFVLGIIALVFIMIRMIAGRGLW